MGNKGKQIRRDDLNRKARSGGENNVESEVIFSCDKNK